MSAIKDTRFNDLFDRLNNILFDIHNSFIKSVRDFDNEWNVNGYDNDNIDRLKYESEKEFRIKKPKLVRKEKQCIIFGDTSAGKSTLINAIVKRNDLLTGYGQTTNCFVEIKKNYHNRTYFSHNDEKFDISLLKKLIDFGEEYRFANGSRVELFYGNENSSLLNEDIIIIDTPGIDSDVCIDEEIIKYCEETDVVVLVCNSSSWINNTMINFIKRFISTFSQINIMLVFNHWDGPDNEDNSDRTKKRFIKDTLKLFLDNFGDSTNLTEENIYFLCAKEQIMVNKNDERLKTVSRWEIRNEEFKRFINNLKTEMNEGSFKRKNKYINDLHHVVKENIKNCENLIKKINKQIPTVSEDLISKFKSIDNLEEKIKEIISSMFMVSYQEFLDEAIKQNKNSLTEEEIEKYNREHNEREFKPVSMEEIEHKKDVEKREFIIKVERISKLQLENIDKTIEKLKEKIIDLITEQNDDSRNIRVTLLNKIYFSFYIDQCKFTFKEGTMSHVQEITNTIRTSSEVTIGLAVLLDGGTRVGACMAGVRLVGAAFGRGIIARWTNEMINYVRQPFNFLWKRNSEPMEDSWKSFHKELTDTYGIFVTNIEDKLNELFISISHKLNDIRERLGPIEKEICNFE